ncbi:MAG: ABC transporter ATP-binding protein [Acidobacteriota bacterium]|nr:ABC transporter ATP-binding protein [Acidobacteriota bacterium]
MTTPSITVEQVSKRFRIGSRYRGYATLRDRINALFSRGGEETEQREIWALRDVSLEIAEGEAVGLIGHNGAGKSTLLKILTRITEPTSGQAVLRGRVGSLLEVGTGFHPELTGRENIFLNGAILGMSRAEIRASFDAIVEFAEVEMFLDTPVKRYSSGMYVRLAFAVAAHLTPEILLVDEVLSVGDINFQRRCLGRMSEVSRSGRTVVFVSHNLGSIEDLCSRAILLSGGQIVKIGPAREVITHYLSRRASTGTTVDLRDLPDREGTGRAKLTGIDLLAAEDDTILDVVEFRQSFRVRLHYEAFEALAGSDFGIGVVDERSTRVFVTTMRDGGMLVDLPQGAGSVEVTIDTPNLLPGVYFFVAWVTDEARLNFADLVQMVGKFEVVAPEEGELRIASITGLNRGYVWMPTKWRQMAP